MVQLTIDNDHLIVNMQGLHKIWALKSRLQIPLSHIRSVKSDPETASRPKGLRAPGTYLPGIITAGTFYQGGKRIFWDVRNPDNAIVIELEQERYNQLILEVPDPQAAIQQIESALT